MDIESVSVVVGEFMGTMKDDDNHRYKSWEHCFAEFNNHINKDRIDYLSLHLAFYLASWGMYRGSSGLLQKDYRVHIEAVQILMSEEYSVLRCSKGNDFTLSKDRFVSLVLELKEKLNHVYASHNVSLTSTLYTKILLGVYACVPAYDRYFMSGMKSIGQIKLFGKKSLESLYDLINTERETFDRERDKVNSDCGVYYPLMKIVDMYFFKQGMNIEKGVKKVIAS
jgi:hypothetical protein